MATQRLPSPIFEPVHRLERCRLGVSFGDGARDAPALEGDVLERLVNRLSANALAHRVGCRSVTALDRYVWDQLAKTSSIYLEREPTPYFTRLAAGSPPLRRAGTKGRPVRVLHDRLTVLGDAAEELWVAAKWAFHDFIHPLPVSSKRLALNDCELPNGGLPSACHRLMDISSADKRARAIREELRSGDLIAAVTALWCSLRSSVDERDLRRYALLYGVWLESRDVLERSSLFRRTTDLLYAHTATWFGQVRVQLDPYLSPLDRPAEFFEAVRKGLATLGYEEGVATEPRYLWDPFHLRSDGLEQGLLVRPRSDVAAFMPNALRNAQGPEGDQLVVRQLPIVPPGDGVHDFDWKLSEFWHPPASTSQA